MKKSAMNKGLLLLLAAGGAAFYFFRHKVLNVVASTPPFPTLSYDDAMAKGIPVQDSREPKDLLLNVDVYVAALDGDRVYFVPAKVLSTDIETNTAHAVVDTSPGDDPAPGTAFDITAKLAYLDTTSSTWMQQNGYPT